MTNVATVARKTQAQMAKAYWVKHMLDTLYTRGQWYRWDGKVWNRMDEWAVEKEVKSFLNPGYTYGVLRQVKSLIQIDLSVPNTVMDSDDQMINLDNGIYHLGKNVLYPHDPSHHITTILPFAYDSKAVCPTWQRYLRSTFVREDGSHDFEMSALVQEALGYSLTTSIVHHIMFWCYGDGSNGKGTLFHVIKQLLGSGRMELNVNGFHHNHYQLALLAGKRVATSAEVNGADKLAEDATIMALVAGDPVQVRMIKQEPFEMQPTVKLWWSMNTLPPIDETSEGVWRRIRIIPFTRKFEDSEKILDLKERLDKEIPGIFNWALEGLRRIRTTGKVSIPKRAEAVKDNYQRESNIVQVFVEDMCEAGPGRIVNRPVFYQAFKRWSIENTHRVKSSILVGQELERLGIHPRKTKGVYVYDGIELKDFSTEVELGA